MKKVSFIVDVFDYKGGHCFKSIVCDCYSDARACRLSWINLGYYAVIFKI